MPLHAAMKEEINELKHKSSTTLIFKGEYTICKEDAAEFAAVILDLPNLIAIDLTTLHLESGVLDVVADAFQTRKTIISLMFDYLNAGQLQILAQAIKENKNLLAVDLKSINYEVDSEQGKIDVRKMLEEIEWGLNHNFHLREEIETNKLDDILKCEDSEKIPELLTDAMNRITELEKYIELNTERLKEHHETTRIRVMLRNLLSHHLFAYKHNAQSCVFSDDMKALQGLVLEPTPWFGAMKDVAIEAMGRQQSSGWMAKNESILARKLYKAMTQVNTLIALESSALFKEVLIEVGHVKGKGVNHRIVC